MGFWEPLFFWIFAIGALLSSIAVLAFRNPLYSALALIVDFFCFAGLYVLLSAHFIAVTQILVYGGAILVLFVFIIMLLNLSDEDLGPRRFSLHHVLAVGAGVAVFAFTGASIWAVVDMEAVEAGRAEAAKVVERAELEVEAEQGDEVEVDAEVDTEYLVATPSRVDGLYADLSEDALEAGWKQRVAGWASGQTTPADREYQPFDPGQRFVVPPAMLADDMADSRRGEDGLFGTVEPIAVLLVNRYVIPFELTAVLLLAAIIGAVIIAKKRLS